MVRGFILISLVKYNHYAISPQAISSGMLRRPPTNLNRQSEEATVLLISAVLAKGIDLTEVAFLL